MFGKNYQKCFWKKLSFWLGRFMETIVNIYFFKFVQKICENLIENLLFKLVFYCFTIKKKKMKKTVWQCNFSPFSPKTSQPATSMIQLQFQPLQWHYLQLIFKPFKFRVYTFWQLVRVETHLQLNQYYLRLCSLLYILINILTL